MLTLWTCWHCGHFWIITALYNHLTTPCHFETFQRINYIIIWANGIQKSLTTLVLISLCLYSIQIKYNVSISRNPQHNFHHLFLICSLAFLMLVLKTNTGQFIINIHPYKSEKIELLNGNDGVKMISFVNHFINTLANSCATKKCTPNSISLRWLNKKKGTQ